MAYWLPEEWHRSALLDEIGTAAAGLYARCGSYIADEGTDGFIPSARARMYGTPEWIQKLVEVGLWTVEEKGFRDAYYFEWGNKTAEEIKRRKKQGAIRQQKYARNLTRQSRVTDASVGRQATRPPFPTPYGGKGRGVTPLRPAHPYIADGTGSCVDCPLPYNHPVHEVAS